MNLYHLHKESMFVYLLQASFSIRQQPHDQNRRRIQFISDLFSKVSKDLIKSLNKCVLNSIFQTF